MTRSFTAFRIAAFVLLIGIPQFSFSAQTSLSESVVLPKIDPQTGLVEADGMQLVVAHCSACHSTALITQNAMRKARWRETIRWMQQTQKLWPLGEAEPVILDYLAKWYGPKSSSRRAPISPHLMPTINK